MDLLKSICHQLELGDLLDTPTPLTGGFLHRMVAIATTTGRYAVKLLNPHIMRRSTAADNFRTAEQWEVRLEQTHLPILPAKTIHGRKMQLVEGQYLYLFDYFDGTALTDGSITPAHCRRMGQVLAEMHNVYWVDAPCHRDTFEADWDDYLQRLAACQPALYARLLPLRDTLYTLQERGNQAIRRLPEGLAICHNDMDPKNVLWQGDDCRVIDLECLSLDSPAIELYETALCWSGLETCALDPTRLSTFIHAYGTHRPLPTDWETLYYANTGRLGWLEYNLKRALGQECDDGEIPLGIAEAEKTLRQIAYYADQKEAILSALA